MLGYSSSGTKISHNGADISDVQRVIDGGFDWRVE
ncbi:hypothetical protein SS1G_00175 [Sclerotinia sclerotiorum 1980 UF-70]|uniref:Uncharacterized protein n=1 Tax=Sclerotinia sclerotiorum (strain ATCC 18683 / 1980 / Ss-1) TaxID=665079 RepID=A7E4F3_SCLS1|nr:hypothetical protein SS1G_00175 [Sclerotinia sclerotiorum 1980 UF-70]EDN90775.1 hypothetical protein SS1G_00175 [Sclerotinia sclerotiorum 1980 UF-70]